jgi:hypothetical protein
MTRADSAGTRVASAADDRQAHWSIRLLLDGSSLDAPLRPLVGFRNGRTALAGDTSSREEWSAEPDLPATQRWLEEVLGQVAGQVEAADGSEALRMALRAAISDLRAQVRGEELEVDIRVRADEAPDLLLWTDAQVPLVENVRAELGASGWSTAGSGSLTLPRLLVPH